MTTTFNDTYEIKSLIGRGGMSAVYLAEHKRLHTRWAVKEVRKQQAARFDFLAESNILKRLQHPMLPRIVDIFEDPERIFIVEDFVEGITLEDLLRRLCGRSVSRHRLGCFGGFTWSSQAVKQILGYNEKMKMELVGEPVEWKQGVSADTLPCARSLGKLLATRA